VHFRCLLNHFNFMTRFKWFQRAFLDTFAAHTMLESPMLSKLHTQNFALLMVAAAIILGGDYFVRDLIHTIKSKASAADLIV
jgi:hypothetical protein